MLPAREPKLPDQSDNLLYIVFSAKNLTYGPLIRGGRSECNVRIDLSINTPTPTIRGGWVSMGYPYVAIESHRRIMLSEKLR